MYNLTNKLSLLIQLIILLLASYSPLAYTQSTKDNIMTNKFDITEYNQHKNSDGDWYFTLPDGYEIRKFKVSKYYLIHKKQSSSPYIEIEAYNSDGILIQKGTQFYDINIDLEDYDLQGNMIKRTTYDAPYKLTIEELRKIIQDNFNIDIMNTRQVFAVNRFEDQKITNLPYYLVRYVDQQNDQRYHQVLLNGNTGEILYSVDGYFVREGNPDIWQEYLKSLKTK